MCDVCLDPTGSLTGCVCPGCGTTSVDAFHVVPQLRYLCDVWFAETAGLVDPAISGGQALA
jgi:hypothetical protein